MKGTLLELDSNPDAVKNLTLKAGGWLTVRMTEIDKAGFAWEWPEYEWKCMEIVDRNYGNFEMGFR